MRIRTRVATALLSWLLPAVGLAGQQQPSQAAPGQAAPSPPPVSAAATCWQEQQTAAPAGVTRTRAWSRTLPLAADGLLEIDNRYGRVEVETGTKPEVQISVTIVAEADNDTRAAALLDAVQIETELLGARRSVRTVLQPVPAGTWQSTDRAFRIHYRVTLPATAALRVTNTFGDVTVTGERTGRTDVAVSYGNVRCERLLAPANSVKVTFGCGASAVAYARQCAVEVSHSRLRIDEARDLELRADYADVTVAQADNLTIHAKSGDLALGHIRNLLGNSGFSRVVVDRLDQQLDMTVRYCDQFAVRSTARSFRSISLDGGYSTINLTFEPDSQFLFDVQTPNGQFFVDRHHTAFMRGETELGEHRGLFGSPTAVPVANVNVRSSYGTVRINR